MLYHPEDAKWKRALRRATNRNVEAHCIQMEGGDGCCVEAYIVRSESRATVEQVGIIWASDGPLSVVCTCQTAKHGGVCCHMAAAVEAAWELTEDVA